MSAPTVGDAASDHPTVSLVDLLGHQWRTDRLGLIATLGLLFSLLVTATQLPFFLEGGAGNLVSVVVQHGYVLAWLLLVGWFTRTVSHRTLVSFWLIGVYPVLLLSVVIGDPILVALGSGDLSTAFLIPLVEESLKALPVLLFFVVAARRDSWHPSATDGLLLGFAVGAGFAFHEDMILGRSVGAGWGGSWGLLFPTAAYVGGGLFSSGPGRWAMAHGGWTALVGLGIGAAFLFRHDSRARLLAVVAFVVATLDHVAINYRGDFGGFDVLLVNGTLPMSLLVVGIVTIVPMEVLILGGTRRSYPFFPGISTSAIRSRLGSSMTADDLLRLHATRDYLRHRRAATLAIWHWDERGTPSEHAEGMVRSLGRMGEMAGAWAEATDD